MTHAEQSISVDKEIANSSDGTPNPTSLGGQLRLGLALLFVCCGIWLPCYALALSNPVRGEIPSRVAWAWSDTVVFLFYRIAPLVWLGVSAIVPYGEKGQLFADFLFSGVYFVAAALLLLKRRTGLGIALGISSISTILLAVENLSFAMDIKARTHILAFSTFLAAFIGYSVLTYILAKAQFALPRT
jgi:uncharacterized membrane protein (UPF0136 family)